MVERAKSVFEENDHLLASVMSKDDEAAREQAIEALLLDDARRVVRRVLLSSRQNVREEDFDDIASTVNLRIVLERPSPPNPSRSLAGSSINPER